MAIWTRVLQCRPTAALGHRAPAQAPRRSLSRFFRVRRRKGQRQKEKEDGKTQRDLKRQSNPPTFAQIRRRKVILWQLP